MIHDDLGDHTDLRGHVGEALDLADVLNQEVDCVRRTCTNAQFWPLGPKKAVSLFAVTH